MIATKTDIAAVVQSARPAHMLDGRALWAVTATILNLIRKEHSHV